MADETETREPEPGAGAERWDRRTIIAAAGGIGLVAVLLLALVAYRSCVFTGCPEVSGLTSWEPAQASVVLDGEGQSWLGAAWRRLAALGVRESGF